MATVIFSKKDLNNADNYILEICAPTFDGLHTNDLSSNHFTFKSECGEFQVNKTQVAPFRIKKKKWNNSQVAFSLIGEPDFMFLKKDFF